MSWPGDFLQITYVARRMEACRRRHGPAWRNGFFRRDSDRCGLSLEISRAKRPGKRWRQTLAISKDQPNNENATSSFGDLHAIGCIAPSGPPCGTRRLLSAVGR